MRPRWLQRQIHGSCPHSSILRNAACRAAIAVLAIVLGVAIQRTVLHPIIPLKEPSLHFTALLKLHFKPTVVTFFEETFVGRVGFVQCKDSILATAQFVSFQAYVVAWKVPVLTGTGVSCHYDLNLV